MRDVLEEYRKTLAGLFALLEDKRALRREKRWDIEARADLDHHIFVLQKEIYEVQDIIRILERREKDDVRYGYRKRGAIDGDGIPGGGACYFEENATE